eukprot:PLAT3102.1.p2 GENE.PLAT3102.1~~PLAT3102.1.p2  ORF type:complete len:266 (+),score=146.76 PLAT3102.1:42-839(+)
MEAPPAEAAKIAEEEVPSVEEVAAEDGAEGGSKKQPKRWFPLESNPDVINRYIKKLGFPTDVYAYAELFSTEDWALGMVPKPVKAVMLLFPIKEASEAYKAEEAARIKEEGQVVSDDLYFIKQTVGNACGTIGLIHSVMNLAGEVELEEGKFFSSFHAATVDKTPDERADLLEENEEIEVAHEEGAAEGQSEAVMDVATHFIAFVHRDGCLYEMDGRKDFPINHGETTEETLLEDACRVIRGFMDRDPGEVRFTLMALAAAGGAE